MLYYLFPSVDFETTDSRRLTEIMRDKWLMKKDFDSVCNDRKFKTALGNL